MSADICTVNFISNEGNYSRFTRDMRASDPPEYTPLKKSTNAEGNFNFHVFGFRYYNNILVSFSILS